MHDNEKLNKVLEEGESVRWCGIPQPYDLFDETHKTSTLISLCLPLVCGIIFIGGYYAFNVSRGYETQNGVMIVIAAVCVMIAWGSIGDITKVKNLLYAVTDRRVVIISGSGDKACSMRIADIDGVRIEHTAKGNCHIRVGSSVFAASARKLPHLACHGKFDIKGDNKIYNGLVMYNVSAEDENVLRGLLEPAVVRAQK